MISVCKKTLFILVFLPVFTPFVYSADNPYEIRAYADSFDAAVGDKITYNIEVDANAQAKVDFPRQLSDSGGLSLRDFGRDEKNVGLRRRRYRCWFVFDTYTPGSYIIPAQKVKITLPGGKHETAATEKVFIEVKSLLSGNDKDELRDIKAPLTIKDKFPVVFIAILAAVISCTAGVFFWLKRAGKNPPKPSVSPLIPRQIAFNELERIEGMSLIEQGRLKEYYYLVSLALRSYLENQFSFKAPEQTTEEFLEAAAFSDKLDGRYVNILKEYLRHCDIVKYARFTPEAKAAREIIETTRRFIEETSKEQP